jgi:hypothetical protein
VWTPTPARSTIRCVRVLPHIKKLDDCFGQFLVRVICDCGACREIEPEALARLVGWKATPVSGGKSAPTAVLGSRKFMLCENFVASRVTRLIER